MLDFFHLHLHQFKISFYLIVFIDIFFSPEMLLVKKNGRNKECFKKLKNTDTEGKKLLKTRKELITA